MQIHVYPACAGIHRNELERIKEEKSLPRMRGDPPFYNTQTGWQVTSTPHARGSTLDLDNLTIAGYVYPACAGIHLMPKGVVNIRPSLPRMRGDPPLSPTGRAELPRSTPHARGSTPVGCHHGVEHRVYPACAGIHLSVTSLTSLLTSLPRMRGDPPPSCGT